ncbi:MAG: acyl-CoA dehydrogenase family protein [Firmicutes bacterium]|nr:acyl-CoA dehydrogenase family protein [Bacillota bacterium]
MAYLMTETGAELLQDVKRFCELEVYKQSTQWDREGHASEQVLQMLREMGYYSLTIPETYGGLGLEAVDIAAVLEEMAKADAGLAVSIAGSNLALRAVLAGGTEEQKEEICGRIAEGQIGAFCLTEAEAGSDALNTKTRAVKLADGSWELTGTKQFITNGSTADFYVVAAVIEGEIKPQLFLVDAETAGLTFGTPEEKLGIRSCDTCEVQLNGCRVSADALVGGGAKSVLAALNEGRALMAAMAVGTAQRAMEEAMKYGKERKQFGKAITENQAIQFRLADMQIKIEAARQLTAHVLQKMDAGMDFSTEAAMAKAFAADTAIEVTGSAMDVFGGYGFMTHFPAEKLLRDARVFQIIEGTGEMQRSVVAAHLLKEGRR